MPYSVRFFDLNFEEFQKILNSSYDLAFQIQTYLKHHEKTFFYLAIASISILACSKNDDPNPSSSF
ncbi:MAG: hypothetical protein ABIP95_04370 [Pelobium sp.]